ncbi:hypothetical protein B0I35DRAFT_325503, partial [Stachybotrys elegans]
ISPGLVGTHKGGSRCPHLDGIACGNLWLQRLAPTRDLFWDDAPMQVLRAHFSRAEETLTSLWKLEPAISRPLMNYVFDASWKKSGADPNSRTGPGLAEAAIDPLYLRDMGFSLPSRVVDNIMVEDFDYVHTATMLGQAYSRIGALLTWAMENRRYEPDSLGIIATFI